MRRLQPYVRQAATLREAGCNPTWGRLQPYVGQAAALRGAGCSPTWGRLQPYVRRVQSYARRHLVRPHVLVIADEGAQRVGLVRVRVRVRVGVRGRGRG